MTIETVLMDLDGTVYEGQRILPGALEAIDFIRKRGIRLLFFTNNSEKNREQIRSKLNNMGIDCNEDDIVSSGYVSALYSYQNNLKSIYVCGSESLKKEFTSMGLQLVPAESCKTLVVGMDSKYDYEKMCHAIRAAMSSSLFIACNKEKVFPSEKGLLYAGCAGMVVPVEYCSGKKVDIVIGKPNTIMVDCVMKKYNIKTTSSILVIGDTFESDILMSIDAGCHNILIGNNTDAEYNVSSISDVPAVIQKYF